MKMKEIKNLIVYEIDDGTTRERTCNSGLRYPDCTEVRGAKCSQKVLSWE